ncbi:hypothetical protein PE067_15465 [Paracoccus sp. DMF-8]|uniref:hypothetical protein n=1 Tax=Paracoccus sp. DMF-8 TaxID=3019445 RepID=UPI0023E3CDDD|nr:hypothetical protein [Paracoccus sp. DMF-8]MDF3607413.1 hypothetical protein [Paracoccus sp. DMF-8]
MSHINPTEPPDWYLEGLMRRYQHLVDELESLTVRGALRRTRWDGAAFGAVLLYMAIGNLWAAMLAPLVAFYLAQADKRQRVFIVCLEMMQISAEFPNVCANVAWPESLKGFNKMALNRVEISPTRATGQTS